MVRSIILSKQTIVVLWSVHVHTLVLKCHTNVIEALLSKEYEYVTTARIQSDSLERIFGHH